MRLETRQSLADALDAAEEVIRMAVPGWQEDRILALAVERLLMIIGEALARIRASEEIVLDDVTDAHKVIGMRNVLVHGYDSINASRLQDAIERSLPRLIQEIQSLLG
jgi:uncharacterized protein with HEPN domain